MRLKEIVSFVVVGGLAAAVNILARILFNRIFNYETSIALAFPIALTFAFVLNRNLVFSAADGRASTQYMRFLAVNLLALAQTLLISVALARWVFPAIGYAWNSETIAHAIGVAIPIFTSYLGHKHFSFAQSK
jgi:putative flippase GtrA